MAMTPTKSAGHEDVPEDVKKLAALVANDWLMSRYIWPSKVPESDGLRSRIADAILADRSRRAKAPAQATELAPDVKGLVEEICGDPVNGGLIRDLAWTCFRRGTNEELDWTNDTLPLVNRAVENLRDDLSHLSAPPAEAKPVAWSVKPLEWKKSDPRDSGGYCDTPFGLYRVWTYHEAAGRWFWSLRPLYGPYIADGKCASETEATVAVEADYEQRALALIVHPDPRAKAAEAEAGGMVLVPREPTEMMIAAGISERHISGVPEAWSVATVNIYRAMLAAAKVTAERDEAREIERKLRLVIDYLGEQNELHASIAEKALVRAEAAESLLASRTTAIEAAIEAMEALMDAYEVHDRFWFEARDSIAQLRSLIAGKETT